MPRRSNLFGLLLLAGVVALATWLGQRRGGEDATDLRASTLLTGPEGARGLADALERLGIQVRRWRQRPQFLRPDSTRREAFVLLGPSGLPSPLSRQAILRFNRPGRNPLDLVLAGPQADVPPRLGREPQAVRIAIGIDRSPWSVARASSSKRKGSGHKPQATAYLSLNANATGIRTARMAGRNPPMSPMKLAARMPFTSSPTLTSKENATWLNVCQLFVAVRKPSKTSHAPSAPMEPPTTARSIDSTSTDTMTGELLKRMSEGLDLIPLAPRNEIDLAALPVRGEIDIVGAGDAVTANVTTALASGATVREAIELANAAASVVIHQLGTTGTASVTQMRDLICSDD